jgi:hypothetical protein
MIIDGTNGVTFPNATIQPGAYNGFSTVVFASSTTWAVPAGITKAIISIVGGGGGGRSSATAASGGNGGAAVAFCTGLSGTLTITVGTGGTGATTGTTTAGTTTSVTGTGVSLSATGGDGAASGVAGARGVGTVTTGTLIAITNSALGANGVGAGINPLSLLSNNDNGWAGSTSTAPVVFSLGGGFSAGKGGMTSVGAQGACGGAVVIQY